MWQRLTPDERAVIEYLARGEAITRETIPDRVTLIGPEGTVPGPFRYGRVARLYAGGLITEAVEKPAKTRAFLYLTPWGWWVAITLRTLDESLTDNLEPGDEP